MHINQARNRLGEIEGELYWHQRGALLSSNVEELEAERDRIEEGIRKDRYPPEINELGSKVGRAFSDRGDRYFFDFKYCTPDKGWEQYDTDQDAYYFGIWINRKERKIITYAEGSITVTTSPTEAIFQAELREMNNFYGRRPSFTVYAFEPQGVIKTEYYQERPGVE